MASEAQIRANRANALKSTGPRSVEGRAVSRFNALKHGIDAASVVLPGENPAEYEFMVGTYDEELLLKDHDAGSMSCSEEKGAISVCAWFRA